MNKCYKCKHFRAWRTFANEPYDYCAKGYKAFGKPEDCIIQPMPTEAGTDPDEFISHKESV